MSSLGNDPPVLSAAGFFVISKKLIVATTSVLIT